MEEHTKPSRQSTNQMSILIWKNILTYLNQYIELLKKFNGNLIIQTCFLRGKHNDFIIDNTTKEEIDLWIEHIKNIKPRKTMVYAIDRETPEKNLEKIGLNELQTIVKPLIQLGFEVDCYGK